MVYFQVSRIGFDCKNDKERCPKFPDSCYECVKTCLSQAGLTLDPNVKINIIDSEEKRIQMFQDLIWSKFLDVLNIKHILLIDIGSGLSIADYPISGAGVNTELLTGFLQANLAFSGSSNSNLNKFYEFQYETFNLLLKNGPLIRICLVLDNKASDSLRNLVSEFICDFEIQFKSEILHFARSRELNFDKAVNYLIDRFNIQLMFPMALAHTITPEKLESIKRNYIQKAILDFANEFLLERQFFFIYNLLDRVQRIGNIEAKIILYEIYNLLEMGVIIPSSIESVETKVLQFQETRATRIANNELISPIIANDNSMQILKQMAQNMDKDEAKKLMENIIKKGQTAEKALAYKEAQKEYEKALYLASGFDFQKDIGRISFMVLELDKKIKHIELEYALESADKAEKRKEYINAIQYYQQGISMLGDDGIFNGSENLIRKLEKKIISLQKII